jgi:hypothetical protein
MGTGQLAHYAVAAREDAVEPLGATLAAADLPTSPVAEFGPDAARFRAFATRDPDGHPVVLATFRGPASYRAEYADSGETRTA